MNDIIRLRHLRAFQSVMVCGGVSAAAQRLNLTQPAISKQLSTLESALGLTLFHRKSGANTFPTKEGIAFYKAIEATLEGLEQIESISQKIAIDARGRLRIAATPPVINSRFFTSTIAQFRAHNPDVNLMLDARHRLDIEEWVASRQVDMAVALLPVENPSIRVLPLIETHAIAVVSKENTLAEQGSLDLSQLAQHHDLILPSRQLLRTRIDQILQSGKYHLKPDIEATSSLTCCQLAASGAGIAICDPFSADSFCRDDIAILSLSPAIPLNYGILLSQIREENPLIQEMIENLSDRQEHFAKPTT